MNTYLTSMTGPRRKPVPKEVKWRDAALHCIVRGRLQNIYIHKFRLMCNGRVLCYDFLVLLCGDLSQIQIIDCSRGAYCLICLFITHYSGYYYGGISLFGGCISILAFFFFFFFFIYFLDFWLQFPYLIVFFCCFFS
ncbi:hypothetical protein L211DRAFT_363453 [Terfezia boudieri ATCC MYA-4762]|uniref:Uncharacterized protein n=1 Tax=Terfezia boudieri ATCC MYA-4762 TaxID=1051890 RepID=A0A3N4M5Z5_9PEZI|nr:hypothetical protein L211DRAFT_363453 [Terfezia boudieri ATCC MYA-4762]